MLLRLNWRTWGFRELIASPWGAVSCCCHKWSFSGKLLSHLQCESSQWLWAGKELIVVQLVSPFPFSLFSSQLFPLDHICQSLERGASLREWLPLHWEPQSDRGESSWAIPSCFRDTLAAGKTALSSFGKLEREFLKYVLGLCLL